MLVPARMFSPANRMPFPLRRAFFASVTTPSTRCETMRSQPGAALNAPKAAMLHGRNASLCTAFATASERAYLPFGFGVGLGGGVGLGVRVGVGLGVRVGVGFGVCLGVGVGLGVRVGVGFGVRLGVGVRFGVGVGFGVGVLCGERTCLSLSFAKIAGTQTGLKAIAPVKSSAPKNRREREFFIWKSC
jgi:hypothetical protein